MVMTVDLRFIEDTQVSLPLISVARRTAAAWRTTVVCSALFGMAVSLEQLAAVQ
jgi:hypothetical protein